MAHYIPILRWKRGERYGLRHVRPMLRAGVTPYFLLAGEQFKEKKASKKNPAVPAEHAFIDELINTWGQQAVYIDASSMRAPVGQKHPILDIAAAARTKSVPIVPATPLGAAQSYIRDVEQIVQQDNQGAALRVDLQELASASTWIKQWNIPINQTDLIADFADNIGTVCQLGNALDQVFLNLHAGKNWRSVTIAGSSIPENFGGYQSGVHFIDRNEFLLWQHLQTIGLPYDLDFGDYATVAVNAPPPGIAWGFPINVKYTLANSFLVCRGVGTTGINGKDMDVQLVEHAKSIFGQGNRGALAGCWGDDRIDLVSNLTETPKGLEHWVQIGVNRHVELTRSNLP